jgi:hypothetical protein
MCQRCNQAYQREHYRQNRAAYHAYANAWTARRYAENRARVLAYLDSHPCVDCGEKDAVVLTFDHVRGRKTTEVSNMLQTGRWADITREIEKCEVRCRNCHLRRHAVALGWRRAVFSGATGLRGPVSADLDLEPKPGRPDG